MTDQEKTADTTIANRPSLRTGMAVIADYLPRLGLGPGVYRMMNRAGDVLYVGKARSLKKRVQTYAQPQRLPIRLQRMVSETATMEFVTTHTEVEALLLESNLIKQLRPRYNILLRDDKSFPDILIRGDHAFPQIVKAPRRAQPARRVFRALCFRRVGQPDPDRSAEGVSAAQLLRQRYSSRFGRAPACSIRSSGAARPVSGKISEAGLRRLRRAGQSLPDRQQPGGPEGTGGADGTGGRSALDFERAASLRDRIRAMAAVQTHQDINVEGISDADVVALHETGGHTCIQVFFFRGGRNNGNRSYFPSHDKDQEPGAVLAAFLGQFYDGRVCRRGKSWSVTCRMNVNCSNRGFRWRFAPDRQGSRS